jgi:hypothetical protein
MFEVCQSCFKRGRGVLQCPTCGAQRPPWAHWMRMVWFGVAALAAGWSALLSLKFGWKGLPVGLVLLGAAASCIGMARRDTEWGKWLTKAGFVFSMGMMALVVVLTILLRK